VSRPSILFKYRTLSNYGFQPCILTLPTEAIENIFLQVDQLDDLHSLTCVNRFFASIACPIYTKRHKIHVTVNSAIVHIRGDSFRALATWRRSRLFTNIRDKHLYCDINDDDHETAKTQLRALQKFLSVPFPGRLFNTVDINSVDGLLPPEMLQFIQLIDGAGCSSASISSGLSNPEWLASSLSHSPKRKLPIVSLSYLRSLHIDNQYFSPQQWSSLLSCLTGPDLEAFAIRGQPTIHALSKFLSRHPRIEKLHFADRWALHTQCIRSSGTRDSLRLPMLSEIEGPPCHLQAILKCLSHAQSALTVKVASDFGMSYLQYVRAVLDLVSLCGPHTNLNIHLSRYRDDNELTLRQLKPLRNIKLPEVASLTIYFPSMSEKSLLVCLRCSFTKCNPM
jgi:hypothetical protein